MASRAHTLFDASGALTDAALRKQLTTFMEGYVAFVKTHTLRT